MGKYRAYESYKDSGVEWLGILPEHWQVNCTKRVANISYGMGGEIDRGLTKGINLLSLPNVTREGNLLSEETPFCEINDVEKQNLLLEKGDLLFNWRNGSASHLGKTAYFDLDGEWTHVSFLLRLRFDFSKSDSQYFQYMLNGLKITGFFIVSKAGVNNTFNLNELSNLKVICPPLEEQKTIARFLDYKTKQIDALIAKKEALLEKLDEKRTALISHAVTKGLDATVPMKDSGIEWLGNIPEHWEVSKAKFVSTIFVPQRNKPELNLDEGLPWLTMDDMHNERVYNTSFKVTKEASIQAGSKYLPKGSIVASCVGNFGVCAINDLDVIINQQLQAFVPNKKIVPEYLCELIRISKDYFQMVATAATVVYVNQLGFANMPIVIPSKQEQEKIISCVVRKKTEIDGQKAKIQQAIDLLKEYRTALITNAVTGKIDVRQVSIPQS